MSDPTEKDLTAAQIRDHELAALVPGLLVEITVRDDDAVRLRAALDTVTRERDNWRRDVIAISAVQIAEAATADRLRALLARLVEADDAGDSQAFATAWLEIQKEVQP
jgi:hypothetical protein